VLTVFCGKNQAYGPSYYCRVEEHRPGIRYAVPQWMFDAAVCAKTRLRNEPLVSWQALGALKQLLAETSQSVVVQHRYSTPVNQGDTDANTTIIRLPGTTESVPASPKPSAVADVFQGDSRGGYHTTGEDAPDLSETTGNALSRRGGV
jgi:hypothetical protein